MSHLIKLAVEVELSRVQGKFATRDEMTEALISELEGADPGGLYSIGPDGNTDYDVDNFSVQEDDSEGTIRALQKKVKALEAEIVRITKA